MTDERLCSIALTLCTGIGALTAQRLVQVAGSAANVFARREELKQLCPDIQPAALKALDTPGIFRTNATPPACVSARTPRSTSSIKDTPT